MKLISNSRLARVAALALLPFLGAGAAQAQPNVDNAPKADNPTNRAARPNRTNKAGAQFTKERLRRQFTQAGITDAATQEKLLAYVEAEVTARAELMKKARQLQTGLRGNTLSDTQVAALLNTYQGAAEEDKTRRLKAQADLKKSVDLAKMPKVEATLALMGFYGDGPSMMRGGNARTTKNGANAAAGADGARPKRQRPNQDNPPAANGEVTAQVQA